MSPTIIEGTDLDAVGSVAESLRSGAVVVAQTDTNYGVFCSPFSRHACERIYDMKGREAGKPLTLFVSSPAEWVRWAYPPSGIDITRITDRYWPGPLNLILGKKPVVPAWVTSGMETVSIVHNLSPVVNVLSIVSGLALAATSANVSGSTGDGIVTLDTALQHIGGLCDVVIKGGGGSSALRSSTILNLVGSPRILRQGDVHVSGLRELLPGLVE